MAIDQESRNQIRRMYYGDHFSINGICKAMSVHADTVKKVIHYEKFQRKKQASEWAKYLHVIEEKLELYPKLTSTRLLQILQDRGAAGNCDSLRRYVKKIRPTVREAFIKRSPMAGEEGQVDWAHFSTLKVGSAERKLYCFVMVLSWSRQTFAKFTFDLKTETFLSCHSDAFAFFQGVPRICLYDNLKSIVLERQGSIIRYNPAALDFSGHYNYELRACNVYRGNEKGIVERKIRFIRDNFFAAREVTDIDQLNREMLDWLNNTANQNPWPNNRDCRINDKFRDEQPKLIPLPSDLLWPEVPKVVRAGKYAHVRFDLNFYSIPYQYVQRALTVLTSQTKIRIYDEGSLIAEHKRSWDKGLEIYEPSHHQELKEFKRKQSLGLLKSQFLQDVPEAEIVLQANNNNTDSLRQIINRLKCLQETYGAKKFLEALKKANGDQTNSIESIEVILRQQESKENQPPSLTMALPDNPKVRDLTIKPHDLSNYDNL